MQYESGMQKIQKFRMDVNELTYLSLRQELHFSRIASTTLHQEGQKTHIFDRLIILSPNRDLLLTFFSSWNCRFQSVSVILSQAWRYQCQIP